MKMVMRQIVVVFCALFLLLTSCKEDNQQRLAENKKAAKKREVIYKNISTNWNFYATPINTTSEQSVASWTEFRQFLDELAQNPGKSLNGYQKKAAELSFTATILQVVPISKSESIFFSSKVISPLALGIGSPCGSKAGKPRNLSNFSTNFSD